MKPSLRVAISALILIVSCTGCGLGYFDPEFSQPVVRKGNQPLRVKGSTTFLPLCKAAGLAFFKENQRVVFCEGGGSQFGVEVATHGEMGTVSRQLRAEELSQGLVESPVALDGIAIVINKLNPLQNLTPKQLHNIYAGKIKNWRQLGGEDLPIIMSGTSASHGTHQAFLEEIQLQNLIGDHLSSSFQDYGSPGEVQSAVQTQIGSVGFIPVGYARTMADKGELLVKIISINGVKPDRKNIENRSYAFVRSLSFVTLGDPQGAAKQFIDFLKSRRNHEIMLAQGFILPDERDK